MNYGSLFFKRVIVCAIFVMASIGALIAEEPDPIDLFNKYGNLLKEYRTNHDYANGIVEGEKYLAEMEKAEGGRKKNYSLLLSSLSYLYDESGDHLKAVQCAREAADIQIVELGDTSEFYIASLTRMANFYSHAELYQEAIAVVEEVRAIYRALGNDNTRGYSILTGNLATYYNHIDEVEKSIEMHAEALAIIERTQGRDCKDYADRLGVMSVVLFKAGRAEEAIQNMKEAIEILEIEVGREHLGYMTFVNNLSQMQGKTGEYVDALINMGIAKDICENLYGTESPRYATYLSNYGTLQAKLGKIKEAIESLSRALEIQRALYGNDHGDVALTLGSLSTCYTDLGEYTTAIRLKSEAMDIFSKTLGKESVYYAQCLKDMATNYYNLGNYYEANKYITEAVECIEKKLGCDNPEYARILLSKATLDYQMGYYSLAIEEDDIAIEIFEKTIGVNNVEYATVLHNKAIHLLNNGRKDEAIALGEESLKLQAEIFGRLHPQYVKTLYILSGFYSISGDYKTAVDYSQKCLSMVENVLGRKNPLYTKCLVELSTANLANHNARAAALNALRCNDLLTSYILGTFTDLTSHERSLMWNDYRSWYANDIPQIAYYYDSKPMSKSAYDAVLFSKSLLLNTDIELLNLIAEEGNAEDINLYHAISDARRQLTKVFEFPVEEQKGKTDSLEAFIRDSEVVLLSRSKAYGDYTKRLRVSWEDVKRALGPKDIAIEFAQFHNLYKSLGADTVRYVAFVLKSDSEAPTIVPICSTPQDSKMFMSNGYVDIDRNKDFWSPLAQVLEGVENIYFAPAGELYCAPIEYFPYFGDPTKTMADVYSLRRLSSTREIALHNGNSNQIATASLFGGLSYGGHAALASNRGEDVASDSLSMLRDSFGPLLETKTEVENIGQYLNRMQVKYDLFTDSTGTEASFRNLSQTGINLLHIATHGFYWTAQDVQKFHFQGFLNPNRFANFSEEDKALVRSGILLSGAETTFQSLNDNFDPDDGILTAKEIAQLDFRGMDLVVLSACQTGLGDLSSDGVFGLQRGFKKAGVQSLLMSLWKVDDKATQILMTNFYKGLSEGMSKVEALHFAQDYLRNYEMEIEVGLDESDLTPSQRRRLNARNDVEESTGGTQIVKPYSSPRYWAAFVLLDAID